MDLVVRNLGVSYKGKVARALNEVNLEIKSGSFVVLVGPSGSGKSTLLRCLAGIVTPTSGQVTADGAPVLGRHPSRGMVFQRDILFPWATIRANVAFALQAKGTPKRDMEAVIDNLLTVVGLPLEVKRDRPAALSGGMRQRAGIARMLAGEPEVMLMDEPFAALDAQTRLRMQDLVTDLWSRLGRTVVFVTHDVDEAIRLSQTIFVLRDGGLVAAIENPLPPGRPAGQLAEAAGYSDLRRRLHDELHESAEVQAASASL
ncbi:MAG: ABC transporter ATP-binding protein [Leifsonia sp.]